MDMMQDYMVALSLDERLSVRVLAAGWRRQEAGEWDYPDIWSTFWRLYRNAHDGATVTTDLGVVPLRAEVVYLVPPGLKFHCMNTSRVEHFYIHFDVLGVAGLTMREIFFQPTGALPPPPLSDTIADLSSVMPPGRADGAPLLGWQCRVQSVLCAALDFHLHCLSAEQVERSRLSSAARTPVLPAVRHIEQHLADHLTNAELAALCSMSEDHFIRRFRECVGQNPVAYIQERRVMRAAQRLLFTSQSIDAIADAVGFGSRYYLTRVFKRRMGIGPAAYRTDGNRV